MIPNNIILTWKDHTVPSYVFNNIKTLNPDKNILFFTDDDCREFLQNNYGNEFVKHFDNELCGCHKADFFRYAYLYKNGGYYTDIDIEYVLSISDFLPPCLEFFSIISAIFSTHIFQAILYATPEHEIIKNSLNDMLENGPNYKYIDKPLYKGAPTERMFHNFMQYSNNIQNDKTKIDLGQEKNLQGRYVCYYKNNLIAYSRYETFNRQCFTDWNAS